MNKNEFISILEAQLIRLPKSDRDDILSDFEAHFAAGLEKGLTEEQVAEQLGDPSELAKTYLENLPTNAKGAQFIPESQEEPETGRQQANPTAQNDGAYNYTDNNQAQAPYYNYTAEPQKRDNTVEIVLFVILCALLGPPAISFIIGTFFGLGGAGIGLICALFGCVIGGAAVMPVGVLLGLGIIFIGIALGALGGLLIIADVAFVKLVVKLIKKLIDWGKSIFAGGNN